MPSDAESIISDGSTSDEDYARPLDLSSSDEDILEMEEEEELDDMTSSSVSRPVPSQSNEVTWVPRGATKSALPDSCEEAGPSEDILLLPEKKSNFSFLALFTKILVEEIVFQTNLYTTQEGKQFTSLALDEMHEFLAINMLIRIKRMQSYRDYWSPFEDLHDG